MNESLATFDDPEGQGLSDVRSWLMLGIVLMVASIFFSWQQQAERPTPPVAKDHFQLDINRASVAEFRALPRIGPQLAQRMVDYRQLNGPFRDPSELVQVPGVGNSTLRELSLYLTACGIVGDNAEDLD